MKNSMLTHSFICSFVLYLTMPHNLGAGSKHSRALYYSDNTEEVFVRDSHGDKLEVQKLISQERLEIQESKTSQLGFLAWAFLSICSSVGIILVNKSIMVDFGFNFVFTLTTLHFACQAMLMQILVFMGIVQEK